MKSRILIYDIETSPLITYTWQTYQTDVIEVIQDWQILCFAYKWLGEKKIHIVSQDDYKSYKPGVVDDINVVKDLHKLFNEAQGVVAHNGDRFDQRKSMARFIQHNLDPPSHYKQVDTKKIASRYFGFTSNRLSDLAKYLGVDEKGSPGGFETWKGCMGGDKKAWRKMKKYNIQDVNVLEQIYLKLRAWDKNGLPMNMLEDRPSACPLCGEICSMKKNGSYVSKTGRWQVWQCSSCGGHPRSRIKDYQQAYEKVDFIT